MTLPAIPDIEHANWGLVFAVAITVISLGAGMRGWLSLLVLRRR
ncbi:hypothetical protein [Mycobacteroides abscessus]|nr:hypothetical protein [Mycobacteroides abscessus]